MSCIIYLRSRGIDCTIIEDEEKTEVTADSAEDIERMINSDKSLSEKERAEYEKQLKEYGIKQQEKKIADLKAKGYPGYYEYTTISLLDNGSGDVNPQQLSSLLNSYALEGWRLVSSYANELGNNNTSLGIMGFSMGKNSTIDQHILILERFWRF